MKMEDILTYNPTYRAFEETPFYKAMDDDEYHRLLKFIGDGSGTFRVVQFKRVWFVNKQNEHVAAMTHNNFPFLILDDDNKKSIDSFIEHDIDIELPDKGGIIYSMNPREKINRKGEKIRFYEVHIKGWKFSDFKIK